MKFANTCKNAHSLRANILGQRYLNKRRGPSEQSLGPLRPSSLTSALAASWAIEANGYVRYAGEPHDVRSCGFRVVRLGVPTKFATVEGEQPAPLANSPVELSDSASRFRIARTRRSIVITSSLSSSSGFRFGCGAVGVSLLATSVSLTLRGRGNEPATIRLALMITSPLVLCRFPGRRSVPRMIRERNQRVWAVDLRSN